MQPLSKLLQNYKPPHTKQSPIELSEINSYSFLKLSEPILNSLIFEYSLSKRQIKIILFIMRFSYGCKSSVASIKLSEFALIGIHASDIANELTKLNEMGFIGWNKTENNLWITEKLICKTPTNNSKKISELLSKNLVFHKESVSKLPIQIAQEPNASRSFRRR